MAESQFFGCCLASGMQEAQSNVVRLPDEDPKTFNELIKWIYLRKVIDEHRALHAEEDNDHTWRGDSCLYPSTDIEKMKAWVLADKLGIPNWQNRLLAGLRLVWLQDPCPPEAHIVSWAIDNVDHDSVLFMFVIQQFNWEVAHGRYGRGVNMCDLLNKTASEVANALQPALDWAKTHKHLLPPVNHVQDYFVDY